MIERLACKMGRNDEIPNIELAEMLCENEDIVGIKEIVDGFNGKDKAIANDCIKVLYEIGFRKPELIAGFAKDFISHLHSKNNRLVWGSMTALAYITELAPEIVFENLSIIKNAYENGSVITIDNSISVFAKLCNANKDYMNIVFPIIINHLSKCRPKEVPQHAERAMICMDSNNAKDFIEILEKRKQNLSPAQIARINKILKKV
ncbi:hypothetical protein JNUCC42_13070 [Brevibacterium sp. JNUCC-42]|nr:hypothetical protein JNUCC42_13070 [Brevibacterium sp. JNUCC-42]